MKKYLRRLAIYVDEHIGIGDRIALSYLKEFLQLESPDPEPKQRYIDEYMTTLCDEFQGLIASGVSLKEANDNFRDRILQIDEIFGGKWVRPYMRKHFIKSLLADIDQVI